MSKDILFRPETVRAALDRLGSMSKAIQELMQDEQGIRFEFRVVNDRVEYSRTNTEVPPEWIAVAMVRAVEEWEVVSEEYYGATAGGRALSNWFAWKIGSDGKRVDFDRHILFDWSGKKIRTSVPADDGDLFLRVAAYFVGVFQKEHEVAERQSGKRGEA